MSAARLAAVAAGAALLATVGLAGWLLFAKAPEALRVEAPEGSGTPADSSAVAAVIAGGDPDSVARTALRECGERSWASSMTCYEKALVGLARAHGVERAMASLERLGSLDQDVRRDGHVYAHAIGIAAYHHDPDVGRTFGRCTEIFQSGCYHGVIQAYFDDVTAGERGVTAENVNRVCRPYHEADDRWLLFQCVHGIGHGLTMFRGHDLPRALADCDLLTEDWDRHACYGGAFMENIVNATQPHHGGSSLRAEGGNGKVDGGHGGHAATGAPESGYKALDPDDPLYPCSALEERYLVDCYQMQTSAILHLNGGDMAATARACDGAPEAMRPWCYQSLGRDISSYTLQDPAESIRMCSLGSPRWQPWCYVGLVKNFVDLTATTESGFTFCRQVRGQANQLKCFEALGEQISVLEPAGERREEACAQAEADFRAACRYGARVSNERPQGLPTAGPAG